MKKNIFILMFSTLCWSCKKDANFGVSHPDLVGMWHSYGETRNSGVNYVFRPDGDVQWHDKGSSGSVEDDREVSGQARIKNDVFRVKGYHFKLTMRPERFDTIIKYDIDTMHTHWRMRLARSGNHRPLPLTDLEGFEYYRR